MPGYDRRARQIRRMQDRAARRRERAWSRQGAYEVFADWAAGGRERNSPRAA